jgi:internalin A
MVRETSKNIGIERIKRAARNHYLELVGLWELSLEELPPEIGLLTEIISLDLSYNKLSKLPPEIGQLNIQELLLFKNRIDELPREIGELSSLIRFDIGENKLTDLPSEVGKLKNLTTLHLFDNRLQILPITIGELSKLKRLTLYKNSLSSLPSEIGRLFSLQELDISSNDISLLPPEIGKLQRLEELVLSQNQLRSLPPEIGQLYSLRELHLDSNRLISLPSEIGELDLRVLNLNGNLISSLPKEILNLKNLEFLDLRKNHLGIPPEILENVDQPQSILEYYFSSATRPLNEVKLLFVGQGSVGKTSLINRLIRNVYNSNENKTEGIAINQWSIEIQDQYGQKTSDVRLNIWDFGGQEIMHATHQFFLTKRSIYILVIDNRVPQEDNRIEYWLKIIQAFGSDSPILILGNKSDQHPFDIDRTGLLKKYPNVVGIFETSAATNAGIEDLKIAIANQVNNLPHVRDLVPNNWFMVKSKLEKLKKKDNFINQDDYIKLCNKKSVLGEINQRLLISFLHDLGIVLHFQDDPRLETLGILNPQWVTNGVYKIINAKSLFENWGVLTLAMLNDILNLPEYPRDKRLFIVDMMKKFELCFDLEHDKTFLVPDLLPKDEPALNFHGIPAFEYHYPILPSSVMTRFIVRMNQKIENDQVWRSGVLLKTGENRALVKADLEDRTVRVAIDGLEHTRRDALAAIRYELDEIHASIKGLNPEKFVPVPGAIHAKPLKYEYLLKLERAGKDTLDVEDGDELREVNILQMLNGVESEYHRRQYGNVTNVNISGNIGGSVVVGDNNDVKSNSG